MYVQEPPVISCLQNLSLKSCANGTCNNNVKRIIRGCDVRYHDCIQVVNTMAPQYDIKIDCLESNPTLGSEKTPKMWGILCSSYLLGCRVRLI